MKKKKISRDIFTPAQKQGAAQWIRLYFRAEIDKFLAVLFLAISMTGFVLIQPYFIQKMIDDGLLARQWDQVTTFMVLMVFSTFAAFVVRGIARWIFASLSGRIMIHMKEDLYDHLLKLSPGFYERQDQKDLLARIEGDMAQIHHFFSSKFLPIIKGFFLLAGSLTIMIFISVKMASVVLLFLAILVLFMRISQKRLARGAQKLRGNSRDITRVVAKSLDEVKLIQTMLGEGYEKRRLHTLNRAFLERFLDVQIVRYGVQAGPTFLITCAAVTLFLMGGADVIRREMSLGALLAFLFYMVFAAGMVRRIPELYEDFIQMRHRLYSVWALRMEPLRVKQNKINQTLGENARGEIILDRVRINCTAPYDPSGQGAEDARHLFLDLHIYPGEKILITGPDNKDKALVGDLFHRHFDPLEGEVRLDGIDIKQLDLHDLRRNVAVIGSEIPPFQGPLADNIRYGLDHITMDQVAIAGQATQIDDFVHDLERGYDTIVGEGGLGLSEGQKQRVAMARALLMDPHVLILDDRQTKNSGPKYAEDTAAFFRLVDHYFEDRTRIIINYDTEAEYEVDRVFVLKDDRLVEMGPTQGVADL